MDRLTITDLAIEGKKVLLRVDLNVPLTADGEITDPSRILAILPTIHYILNHKGSVILMSHLGRPKGEQRPNLSLAPVGKMLAKLLEKPVQFSSDCIGNEASEKAYQLKEGEILLLENLRFHRAEEHPEEGREFAEQLAALGDLYVNDAFGCAHRKHSSVYTIADFFPERAACGLLMQQELRILSQLIHQPKRPFHALIGGSKISSKIGVLSALLDHVDTLLIGGAMANTFLKAQGIEIGSSLFEKTHLDEALKILKLAEKKKVSIALPIDLCIAKEESASAKSKMIEISQGVPLQYKALDIGEKTCQLFDQLLEKAQTILWNGPVGMFELEPFGKGTFHLAKTIAHSSAFTVVGGGDSLAAINEADVQDKISHLSTGGGATLEFLEFGSLPGVDVLTQKNNTESK